jgi:hypothetical protein
MDRVAIEKEGDGRYLVRLDDPERPWRMGRVLGGYGRWMAESVGGESIGGVFHTRREAVAALCQQFEKS